MITFRQKEFTEYDAMRSLYVRIMERSRNDRNRYPVINTSALLPILKGNNIVIERFVISTSIFGKDVYRMYLKIGARAKLPDEVRLPGNYYDKKLLGTSISFEGGLFGRAPKPDANVIRDAVREGIEASQKNNSDTTDEGRIRLFSKKNRGNRGGGNNGGNNNNSGNSGGGNNRYISVRGNLGESNIDIKYQVKELLGEAIKYDKKDRSLVLEFPDIDSAIDALNILPFGLNYKIYLLDA